MKKADPISTEIIRNNKNGFLVFPCAREIAKKLDTIFKIEDFNAKIISENARNRIVKQYSQEVLSEQLLLFYNSIIS